MGWGIEALGLLGWGRGLGPRIRGYIGFRDRV